MPSLKDLKNRIGSVKSTRKITKAMQMVAAAKLKRAQSAAVASRPYATRMAAVIANLSSTLKNAPGAPEFLVGRGEIKKHLLVVMSADRGLCGGFNTNIVRRARERIVELERAGQQVSILCVGRKGEDQLKRLHGDKIIDTITLREEKTITSAVAQRIALAARTPFEEGAVDAVSLVYAQFKSVLVQEAVAQTVIPAIEGVAEDAELPDLKGAVYSYEPSEEEILVELLPRNLTTQVFAALLDNAAGEQGARMTAMDNATRNAGDMIDSLSLTYNRMRQANITKELIEIISGAEAL